MQFNTLDIVFSEPINELKFTFAVDDANETSNSNPTLTANGFSGGLSGTLVATSTVTPTIPTGYTYPEGLMDLSNANGFDAVAVTSNIGDFALGWDLSGRSGLPPAGGSAPEPGTAVLALGAIGGLAFWKRRARA